MNALRYRLDIPSTEPKSFTISNCDGSQYLQHILKRLKTHHSVLLLEGDVDFPPIKMTVLECMMGDECKDVAECLYGEQDSWISDMIPGVLHGEFPDWRLCAVDFSRYNTKLRFYNEGTDAEDLYISKEASMVLRFEVYRGKGLSPYIYTMNHNVRDDDGYITSELLEEIDGKPMRLFEFGVEIVCASDFDNWRSNYITKKEYLIVTEFH